jgi:hypothetical protein
VIRQHHALCIATAILGTVLISPAASASIFTDGGATRVWVTIKAAPGEGRWEACRRVYQRDVYRVRRKSPRRVRCYIDHSRLFDGSEYRYRNHN